MRRRQRLKKNARALKRSRRRVGFRSRVCRRTSPPMTASASRFRAALAGLLSLESRRKHSLSTCSSAYTGHRILITQRTSSGPAHKRTEDVPRCGALSLLQKPLNYRGIHQNSCAAIVHVGLGPVVSRARVLVYKVLDRRAQAVVRGGAR
jgi:hypothetical protein